MRTKRSSMAAIACDPSFKPKTNKLAPNPHHDQQHGIVIEEIEGLIKVYQDGYVERPQIVPCVTTAVAPELGVTSHDVVIDNITNIWARFYVPKCQENHRARLPLLVYFHGGGFCVGSAAWGCYHAFLATLAAKAGCLIMSVNYRLVPEHPLPAAYEDGFKSLTWLKRQSQSQRWSPTTTNKRWSTQCDFSSVFLAGDSAGANIAHSVATRLCNEKVLGTLKPLVIKGTILLQPFFGAEARTCSEKNCLLNKPRSVLSVASSDTYWRLALPPGANRDHPWCNPLKNGTRGAVNWPNMVCISEMDILKDRNLEFCEAFKVEKYVVYKGVGHAFQVLDKSQLSKTRSDEMVTHIKAFVNNSN